MASLNKVQIIGNLGRDPEMRYTANGRAVATMSVACSRRFTTQDGERREETEWVRVVAWARLAELASQYLAKGRSVYVEGRLQTREYEDREGQRRFMTEVVAQDIQFLDRRGGGDYADDSGSPGGGGGAGSVDPDDLPFE
ncbi:MAG: single-stranded DNA-binding protein [Chloroflexi bacterium]|nr:single-stranded DNA-binding protein [Chloroflexota bacterium]